MALALVLPLAGCTSPGGSGEDGGAGADGLPGYASGPYRAPAGALLADPVPDEEYDTNSTLRTLLDNIAHTPPGATIRIVARSFSLVPVADALVAARERGVRVQVLADGDVSRRYQNAETLREGLGTDRDAGSFFHLTRGSARGGDTELHQKSWSFSRTGDARWVTMVGSMNLSYYSTGQYTDMYSFVGRRDVWRVFSEVFAQQKRDRRVADPAVSRAVGRDHLWFFPGYGVRSDPVRGFLQALTRQPADDVRLRIAQYAWVDERGIAIAEQVAALARVGADVEVIGNGLGRTPERLLREAGVPIRPGVFDNGDDIHLKLLLASWTDRAGREHRRISTGSDNFGTRSLYRDEVLVSIAADRGPAGRDFRAYQRFLDRIVARGRAEA